MGIDLQGVPCEAYRVWVCREDVLLLYRLSKISILEINFFDLEMIRVSNGTKGQEFLHCPGQRDKRKS